VDDVFDFLVAGASAVEIGTANFYEPDVTTRILDALPVEMEKAGIKNIADIIGTLEM
ncbi:MAG: dihydroorotate dehydrogenase, partial [Thermoguttaceae bacterium]|nr:dihydroorotate dehydrogenase [Thermoguttaceae bacterium]